MYNAQNLGERIKSQAREKNILIRDLLTSCDLSINTISQMTDKNVLSSFSLAKIAYYLQCSVDYLLGRTDNPEFGTPTLQNSGNHIAFGNSCQNNSIAIGDIARDVSSDTEELEQEICSILKRLPLRKRTELLTIMYHYVDENEEKEGE